MPPLHEQICWYFWLQHSHCNNSAKARHTTRFGLSQGGRFGSFLRAYIENRMCIDDSSTSSPPTTCKNVEKSRRGPPSPVKVTRMYVRIINTSTMISEVLVSALECYFYTRFSAVNEHAHDEVHLSLCCFLFAPHLTRLSLLFREWSRPCSRCVPAGLAVFVFLLTI